MPSPTAQQDHTENQLRLLSESLDSGTFQHVKSMLRVLHPAEIAHMLEALQPADREIAWRLVPPEMAGDVLVNLNDEVRGGVIEATDSRDLVSVAATLETDELADLLHDLPEVVLREVLFSMDKQDRKRLESVLSYGEDSAGGLMSLDTVTVRPDVSLDVVMRYLRLRGNLPESTDNLFVVDRKDRYLGILPLSILLTQDLNCTVAELMLTNIEAVPAETEAGNVAMMFEQRDLVSAPVVDQEGKLLGRITVDDAVDVIRDEADHSLMSMAGLDEEQDMFAPVFLSAKRRTPWLGINLFTAFLASWVIGLFEATLERVVALAILMPIVASMGGIAGSQTLTLVIRGLVLRQIGKTNANMLLAKEFIVGIINGVLWSLVVATLVYIWFQNIDIALLIGVALVINLVCAALSGASIPLMLHRFGVDPALAGGVVLTTVTDIVGFLAFLGLATLFLL